MTLNKALKGGDFKIAEQAPDFRFCCIQINVGLELASQVHGKSRMAWINFPRVDVENNRSAFPQNLPGHILDHGIRKEPQVSSPEEAHGRT
jgi:hypothetical protein